MVQNSHSKIQCLKPVWLQYTLPSWYFPTLLCGRKVYPLLDRERYAHICVHIYLLLNKFITFYFLSEIEQPSCPLCSCWANAHCQKLEVSTVQPIFHKQKGQDLLFGTQLALQLPQTLLLKRGRALPVTQAIGKGKNNSFPTTYHFSTAKRPVVLIKTTKSPEERYLKKCVPAWFLTRLASFIPALQLYSGTSQCFILAHISDTDILNDMEGRCPSHVEMLSRDLLVSNIWLYYHVKSHSIHRKQFQNWCFISSLGQNRDREGTRCIAELWFLQQSYVQHG